MSLLNDIANNPFNLPELSTQQAIDYMVRQLQAKFRVPVTFYQKTRNDEPSAVTSINFSIRASDFAVLSGIAKKKYPSMTNRQAWESLLKQVEELGQEGFEDAHGRPATHGEWDNIFYEQILPDFYSELHSAMADAIRPIVAQFPDIASVHPTSGGVDIDYKDGEDNPELDCQIIIRLAGKTK